MRRTLWLCALAQLASSSSQNSALGVVPATISRVDHEGVARHFNLGWDGFHVVEWLKDVHRAKALATCGRTQRSLQRRRSSQRLAQGLTLPGPSLEFAYAPGIDIVLTMLGRTQNYASQAAPLG